MKRYEKMSKEEIIESLLNRQCNKCKALKLCGIMSGFCDDVIKSWLNEEVEMKPRWALIQSDEDIYRLYDEFETTIPNTEDIHYAYVFAMWLKEEVEV